MAEAPEGEHNPAAPGLCEGVRAVPRLHTAEQSHLHWCLKPGCCSLSGTL